MVPNMQPRAWYVSVEQPGGEERFCVVQDWEEARTFISNGDVCARVKAESLTMTSGYRTLWKPVVSYNFLPWAQVI